MSEDIKWQEEASGLIHFGNGLRVDIGETTDAIAHRLRTDAAALAAAEAERERLREALATLRERGCKYETADRPAPDDCECAGCIARAALAGPAATRGGEGT